MRSGNIFLSQGTCRKRHLPSTGNRSCPCRPWLGALSLHFPGSRAAHAHAPCLISGQHENSRQSRHCRKKLQILDASWPCSFTRCAPQAVDDATLDVKSVEHVMGMLGWCPADIRKPEVIKPRTPQELGCFLEHVKAVHEGPFR